MADAWMDYLTKFDLVGLHEECEKVGYRIRVVSRGGYTFDIEYQGGLDKYYGPGLAVKKFENTDAGRAECRAFLATVGKEPEFQVLFTFTTPEGDFYKIRLGNIASALCNALEGGSNSWYMIESVVEPTSWDYVDELEHPNAEQGAHWKQDYPVNPGGGIWFSSLIDREDDAVLLNAESIQRGLQVLNDRFQWHLIALAGDDAGDADTGDAFLQACLYGDIVYG